MQQHPTILPPPSLPDGTPGLSRSEERENNLIRFQAELEFIQCLSNPQYLHSLSTQGYFTKKTFLNYLKYLEYWRKPDYIRFIIYPTCLIYLTLLQSELFRSRLSDLGFINELIRVGVKHHETWRVEKPPTSKQDSTQPNSTESKAKEETGDDKPNDEDEG